MRSAARLWCMVAALSVVLAWGTAARAERVIPIRSDVEMTTTEMQSLSCLGTGGVSAATMTVIVLLSPLEALTLPAIAAAFAAGCGVGAFAAPGVHWIARNLGWSGSSLVTEAKP